MTKARATHMRTKLTALLTTAAVLATAATAFAAGVIPVAIFTFENPNDINSFQKTAGGAKCLKKIRPQAALGINIGDASPVCSFRTSVIADSGDLSPSQEIQTSATWEKKTPKNLQAKLFVGVQTRANATGHYELRVVPVKKRWILLRDPNGAAPATTLAAGLLKSIKPGATKPTNLLLRTFAGPTGGVAVTAVVNGAQVFNASDLAPDPPSGRFNGISVGSKTGATGLGMRGTFDDITVRVPSPF